MTWCRHSLSRQIHTTETENLVRTIGNLRTPSGVRTIGNLRTLKGSKKIIDRIRLNIAHLSLQTRKTRSICYNISNTTEVSVATGSARELRTPRPRPDLDPCCAARVTPSTGTTGDADSLATKCIRVHAVEGGRVGMEPEGLERRRVHLLHFPLLLPPHMTKSLQLGAGPRAHQGCRWLAHTTQLYHSRPFSKWLWPRCYSPVRLRALQVRCAMLRQQATPPRCNVLSGTCMHRSCARHLMVRKVFRVRDHPPAQVAATVRVRWRR